MINVAVEGESDRAAASAIVLAAGRTVGDVVVAGGKTRLDPKIVKYHAASRRANWVVFRDSDGKCPVELRKRLIGGLPSLSPRFALRIAHSMTEAWLMADPAGFSDYFRVRPSRLPTDPEHVAHAKQTLLSVCSGSLSRAIRQDMVTARGETGPLYVQRINEFASTRWNVEVAVQNSRSLARAVENIKRLPRP